MASLRIFLSCFPSRPDLNIPIFPEPPKFPVFSTCRCGSRAVGQYPILGSTLLFEDVPSLFGRSSGSLSVENLPKRKTGTVMATSSDASRSNENDVNNILPVRKAQASIPRFSFIAKLAVLLGIAATVSIISCLLKWPESGSSFSYPFIVEGPSHTGPPTSAAGFNFTLFGYNVVLPEYTPGWVYFWLLMAAGCGLFISEEALNVWVGISLARKLSLDGTWKSFALSFSSNAPYIISTIIWVYWGVCISDMIPFYLGKLFRSTKASEDICSKIGVGKDKVVSITRLLQKYGNLIGFIERFSIGIRNPTAFMAGAWEYTYCYTPTVITMGISADCFFAGVCFGGIITLSVQLGVGILLREHPVMALASVATAVGIWTVFPYLVAFSTALFLFFHRGRADKSSSHFMS